MSWFNRNSTKKTVAKMNEQIKTLEKKEDYDRKRMEMEFAKAKECKKKGDNTGASQHLKKKKLHEKSMNDTIALKTNLEGQILEIEGAKVKVDTAKSFQSANKEMTKINKQMDPAKIEKTMEGLRENNEKSREVGELLGEDLVDVDLGELEDELADLSDELADEREAELDELEEDLPKPKTVKQKAKKQLTQEEEDELAELM
ncbi:SNF7 family protein [Entamoeba marina]